MELLGFTVTKTDGRSADESAKKISRNGYGHSYTVPVAYELHGPRGAHYGLIRNAHRPHLLFVVNLKPNCYSTPSVRGYGWFSDETGSLEPVN